MTEEVDLGKGTFLENWPKWIRWVLFIPASIILPVIIVAVQLIFISWYLNINPEDFYFNLLINLLRGAMYGGGIVIVGSVIAPKHQRVISLVYLILLSMLVGISFLYQINNFVLIEFLENVATISAAGFACYFVFNETSKGNSSLLL